MSSAVEHPPIPLCEPNLPGNEKQYIVDALDSNWLSGGSYLTRFEKQLSDFTGAPYVVGVSSGTTALQVALILAGVQSGDLVICPNLTFVATGNAIKYTGADPILVDIDANTWQLDLGLLTRFLESETYISGDQCYHKASDRRISAIVTVHLLGNMCDMEQLLRISARFHLPVLEDAACALGSYQHNRHAGTFGLLGTLSFNSNKIITTAGGGAILTADKSLAARAKHLITQAKSSQTEYFHDSLGFNYRLVNPLAAIGVAQMELLPSFIESKTATYQYYQQKLADTGVRFQLLSPDTISNYWHTAILTDRSRELIAALAGAGIESRPLWIPLNELPVFSSAIYITEQNHAQQIASSGVMLPCSTSITLAQLERVTDKIRYFISETKL